MKFAVIAMQALMIFGFLGMVQGLQAQSIEVKLPQNSDGVPTLSFGKMTEGAEGDETSMSSQVITLKNNGDQTINLLAVHSDCACLTAELPENATITAGSEVSITIYYNNRRLGPFAKMLEIQTDASGQEKIAIEVTGEVQLRAE